VPTDKGKNNWHLFEQIIWNVSSLFFLFGLQRQVQSGSIYVVPCACPASGQCSSILFRAACWTQHPAVRICGSVVLETIHTQTSKPLSKQNILSSLSKFSSSYSLLPHASSSISLHHNNTAFLFSSPHRPPPTYNLFPSPSLSHPATSAPPPVPLSPPAPALLRITGTAGWSRPPPRWIRRLVPSSAGGAQEQSRAPSSADSA
jgi:hypothetical protein